MHVHFKNLLDLEVVFRAALRGVFGDGLGSIFVDQVWLLDVYH